MHNNKPELEKRILEQLNKDSDLRDIQKFAIENNIPVYDIMKFLGLIKNPMPQTKRTIEASIETDMEYKQRKIDAIIHHLLKNGQIPDRSMVIQEIHSKVGYTQLLAEYTDKALSNISSL